MCVWCMCVRSVCGCVSVVYVCVCVVYMCVCVCVCVCVCAGIYVTEMTNSANEGKVKSRSE